MEDGRFPFVRVMEASGDRHSAGAEFVTRLELTVRAAKTDREEVSRHGKPVQLKSIDAFRANPLYRGDRTRSDLAYAIYALAHGCHESEVSLAIGSRDLSHKGSEKRQREYVARTVVKASAVLSRQSNMKAQERG